MTISKRVYTLFVKVGSDTHTHLATIAAKVGVGRLDLYRIAIKYALSDPNFEDHVLYTLRGIGKKVRP